MNKLNKLKKMQLMLIKEEEILKEGGFNVEFITWHDGNYKLTKLTREDAIAVLTDNNYNN